MPNLFSQFFAKVLRNSEKIPHDKKFPYLSAFAEKVKAEYGDRSDLSISEVISNLNEDIKSNSKKRLFSGWFSTSSSVSTGVASATLSILDTASRAATVAIPIISTIPATINLVYGAMNKGWQLNRDLEGRGYLLKYLENTAILMIGDLYEKREILKERIKNIKLGAQSLETDENLENLEKSLKDLEDTIKKSLDQLCNFNKTHYQKIPFYYKWAAMTFRSIGSLSGIARFGLSVATAVTAFFSNVGALVLAGTLLASDLVFTALYRKSHQMRNESALSCAANLDQGLQEIFAHYEKQEQITSLQALESRMMISPKKAKKNLSKAMIDFKREDYVKFLYRNHKEQIGGKDFESLPEKEKRLVEKAKAHHAKHHHKHQHEHHHEQQPEHHHEQHPEHQHEHQHEHHHHHHHHIDDRYFGQNCSHHLDEKISEESFEFGKLCSVDVVADQNASILPNPTHVHLPFLNNGLVEKSMKAVEESGKIAATLMGGRSYKKKPSQTQNPGYSISYAVEDDDSIEDYTPFENRPSPRVIQVTADRAKISVAEAQSH